MKCVICKHGETKKGKISVTLGQDGMMLIFKEVAPQVCSNYGEEYLGAEKLVGTVDLEDVVPNIGTGSAC